MICNFMPLEAARHLRTVPNDPAWDILIHIYPLTFCDAIGIDFKMFHYRVSSLLNSCREALNCFSSNNNGFLSVNNTVIEL
jgi:hypothetical protein